MPFHYSRSAQKSSVGSRSDQKGAFSSEQNIHWTLEGNTETTAYTAGKALRHSQGEAQGSLFLSPEALPGLEK